MMFLNKYTNLECRLPSSGEKGSKTGSKLRKNGMRHGKIAIIGDVAIETKALPLQADIVVSQRCGCVNNNPGRGMNR